MIHPNQIPSAIVRPSVGWRTHHDSQHESMEYTATNLKAGQFTFPVLELYGTDMQSIADEVGEKVEQAPGFFANTPVVIDLASLEGGRLDLVALTETLRGLTLNPVAVRGADAVLTEQAIGLALAVLPEERRRRAVSVEAQTPVQPEVEADTPEAEAIDEASIETEAEVAQPVLEMTNRMHLRPVRSGQNLAAPRGDLTVIASTSAGSELVAAGSIHVYGALRGRALAGVSGDESCQIFCQKLDAELVSIAGVYRISEDIEERFRGQPVRIALEGETLVFSLLRDIL